MKGRDANRQYPPRKSRANKEAHTNKTSKNSNLNGDWHTNHSSLGMGDYYGQGVKAKIGKMRSGVGMEEISPKKLNTPPRSVV